MICPTCGTLNLPGADWCQWCEFALMAVDRPEPQDRIDRSLMLDLVTVLQLKSAATLFATAELRQALDLMAARGVGAVLVVDAQNQLCGILTERDFLNKVAGRENPPRTVGEVMTPYPETVTPRDTLAFTLGKMAGGNYRHVPVVENGVPVGLVSIRDVLKHIVQLCRD
jgi:CBS domain-containing protein